MKITIDRSLLENVTETLEGMVNANWRNWEELSSPEEFERWVKSRANFLALALREALAHPQQEPVAVVGSNFQLLWCREHWAIGVKVGDKLYASPPARKPLTNEQIGSDPIFRAGVRFAEAAHGIKEAP